MPETEETLGEVATLGAAEPPAREVTGTPRAVAAEGTVDTRAEALSEPTAPAPRRTAGCALTSLSSVARGK